MNHARFFRQLLSALLLGAALHQAGARTTQDFDAGWRFSRGDFMAGMLPEFADQDWQPVTLPHDWSSDGPFAASLGSGNGFAPGGIGWYRKHFQLAAAPVPPQVALEFDGVYDFSEVWVNGQYVGGRPYGFASFQCNLTPFVHAGNNVVAVRVDHSRFADSRYYTGSGIYRNVRLVVTGPLAVAANGVAIVTPQIKPGSATVRVQTTVENHARTRQVFTLETDLIAPDGAVAVTAAKTVTLPAATDSGAGAAREITQELTLPHPAIWDLDTPQLYHAVSRVLAGGGSVDTVTNAFGVREFHFDASRGFFLNGTNLKLKGVCLHHDAGPLGAAVPDPVLERRLRTLKEIGVNAIRTSHNPPDPALLDLCDRLGFLVMDEAFDEFTPGKKKWVNARNRGLPSHFGYNEIFADWGVRDIQDLVRRDRNHPSIILWSIGNEVDYANDPFTHPILGHDYHPENPPAEQLVTCARPLVAAVKALDRTRPVTAALANLAMSDAVGLPGVLDAAGYNYQESRYAEDHRQYPHRIIYGSENSHNYDAWLAVRDTAFISGQFLWTGADYLGEADAWPNRASAAGLLDLCGFKKPLGWFRQSLWSSQPMVHLCVATNSNAERRRGGFWGVESWNNWPVDRTVTVHCFANCPEVSLLVNGKRVGTRKITEAERGVLRWELPYEPGTLTAIGQTTNGQEICRDTLTTTGPAARVQLLPDVRTLAANGKDICHLEFQVVDAQGLRVPDAASAVTFAVTGPGKILGLGNADVNSVEDCKGNIHSVFQGRGLAILQSGTAAGKVSITATATGLAPASVTLTCQ